MQQEPYPCLMFQPAFVHSRVYTSLPQRPQGKKPMPMNVLMFVLTLDVSTALVDSEEMHVLLRSQKLRIQLQLY